MEIIFYKTNRGDMPAKDYFDKINDVDAGQITAVLRDVKINGLNGPRVRARQIQDKLWELKIGKHRLFYTILDGSAMVILHAGKKQRQKADKRDVGTAKRRLAGLKT